MLVHEWLVRWGGSESVLASLRRILPRAPVHTLFYRPDARVAAAFGDAVISASPLNRLPGVGRWYRWALPVMPVMWRRTDLGPADLVVTSSHAFCKGVQAPGATHVCYCHTPPRYLWDLSEEYERTLPMHLGRRLLGRLRELDLEAAQGVDHFIANSAYVADRIRRTYGRAAEVIPPPVDVDRFVPAERPRRHFLAGGRLVPYKRIDQAIEAANQLRAPLVVFGDGPELPRLRRLAGPSVTFTGSVAHDRLLELMQSAIAFVFPGIEDFGILPVEAQATGTPVVALAAGGAEETVRDGVTGILYDVTSGGATPAASLAEAMDACRATTWSPEACRTNAERFSRELFEERFRSALTRLGVAPGDQA